MYIYMYEDQHLTNDEEKIYWKRICVARKVSNSIRVAFMVLPFVFIAGAAIYGKNELALNVCMLGIVFFFSTALFWIIAFADYIEDLIIKKPLSAVQKNNMFIKDEIVKMMAVGGGMFETPPTSFISKKIVVVTRKDDNPKLPDGVIVNVNTKDRNDFTITTISPPKSPDIAQG